MARWLVVSVGVHAVLWIGFTARARPLADVREPPPPMTLEVQVRPAEPIPDPPGLAPERRRPAKRVGSTSSSSSSSPPRGAPAKPPPPDKPPAEPARGKWIGMRGAGPSVRTSVGQPEGPPAPDPLRIPDRTPLPIPGKGPGPLGPDAKPDGDGGYRFERTTFVARVRRDGTVKIEDKPPLDGEFTGLGVAVSFDLTDMIMRAIGDDPYAFEKLKILDATREARAGMARQDRTERIREALIRLPRDLTKIWAAQERWGAAERRRILFRLWDEVIEEGEAEAVRAGAQVRGIIVTFIRRNLPAGGPDAYTGEEIGELNRGRKSRASFDPYSEP